VESTVNAAAGLGATAPHAPSSLNAALMAWQQLSQCSVNMQMLWR